MKILSSLKGLNSRLEQAEEVISKLKNKATEILVQGVDRKKKNKSEWNLRPTGQHKAYQYTSKGSQKEKKGTAKYLKK